MKIRKNLAAAALVLFVAAAPAGMAKDKAKSKAKSQRRDARVEQTFTTYDTNRDGRISRSEFPADATYFNRFDANRDGWLTRTEAQNAFRNESARMKGMDRNNDGVITRSEWRGNANSFAQLDRNRDGVLSAADHR